MTLLQDLQTIRWNVAAKVYGNNHAFLIGLFTHWWVSALPEARWALESGPSFGHYEQGKGGGMCDAILGEDNQALGVLEVEGTRGPETARKIGHFFDAQLDHYQSLTFGILVLYAYNPAGRGPDGIYRPAENEETIKAIGQVSNNHPDKAIALVAIDKLYNPQAGIRAKNPYYAGELCTVTGLLYEAGKEVGSLILYEDGKAL